jgi:protocatechuate 3,4-dioxygenase beta subunit
MAGHRLIVQVFATLVWIVVHAECAVSRVAAQHSRESAAVLAELESQLSAGARSTTDVLTDPALMDLHSLSSFRDLIRRHTTESRATIVTPQEPGQSLLVSGTVRDGEGHALEGVLIYVYQTDGAGFYSDGGHDADNPRLFGFMRTGADGSYQLRTIKPGAYADSPRTPIHIHYALYREGYRSRGRPCLYFADDRRLTGDDLEEIRGDGCGIVTCERGADGDLRCVYDLVMEKTK